MIGPDLIDPWGVKEEGGEAMWFPRRDCETRGMARHKFMQEYRRDGKTCEWTQLRVTARHVHLHPERFYEEGVYVECDRRAPGATSVWRIEA